MKSWQYGKEALMTLYFTLHIYKHKLVHPEVLTEYLFASGLNLEIFAMNQLGWYPKAKWTNSEIGLKIYYKPMEIIN